MISIESMLRCLWVGLEWFLFHTDCLGTVVASKLLNYIYYLIYTSRSNELSRWGTSHHLTIYFYTWPQWNSREIRPHSRSHGFHIDLLTAQELWISTWMFSLFRAQWLGILCLLESTQAAISTISTPQVEWVTRISANNLVGVVQPTGDSWHN